ncbi:hypothetical protein [Novosphingobium sp. PC22D]|uniref:hypothetical protein n=1 Tax=Novosphingobium sp. PC22D TaxID=1962403 RepID=UPI000BEF6C2E|nr:hypothetical protein [Novosphingobium sp. PC22D]
MDRYVLKFLDGASHPKEPICFRAPDASEALLFARTEVPDRDVELWKGSTRLCTLRGSQAWSVRRGTL